jgi:phosphopantothenate---cysteine ligase (CTP)
MTILITAGSTSEPIDSVRRITNSATGRLGALTAESLYRQAAAKIIYVCESSAVLPQIPNLEVIHTEGTAELANTVGRIMRERKPDAVIHSMAISDYMVDSVYAKNGEKLDTKGKISSSLDGLTVNLVPTPKIIALIKKACPETLLVGFKLLDGVSRDELIEIAYRLLVKNRCDFVFANDRREVQGDSHAGYLINPDRSYARIDGKKNIAEAISNAIVKKWEE